MWQLVGGTLQCAPRALAFGHEAADPLMCRTEWDTRTDECLGEIRRQSKSVRGLGGQACGVELQRRDGAADRR